MKFFQIKALFLAGALTLSVAACGEPTVEGSDKRYKAAKDKISVLITKQPQNKAELDKKVAEFEQEYEAALKAGSDEEKIKKLNELSSRMEKYISELEKAATPEAVGGAEAPSGKLDGASGAPPATGPAPAGGSKLDGGAAAPASGGMGGGAEPASGGMGGGAAAPAGGTAPSGGMGGM